MRARPQLDGEDGHQVSARGYASRKVLIPRRTDPLDQTSVVYMDTGERIPCDVVVLKDANGEVITVT